MTKVYDIFMDQSPRQEFGAAGWQCSLVYSRAVAAGGVDLIWITPPVIGN